MTTAAIIAEFNPFHNGHKYLIDMVKNDLKADHIIVIMSGDFVQKGEPAIIDKKTRAKVCTQLGIDMVLLLPLPYSTGAADLFAFGAVSVLERLNCVDYLCFGSECGDIDTLVTVSDKLSSEYDFAASRIKENLSKGMTYPQARDMLYPQYSELLNHSNNVLALEYIRYLHMFNSKIRPYTIKRKGNEYNDTCVESFSNSSATAIRKFLCEPVVDNYILSTQLPLESFEVMRDSLGVLTPVTVDMFSEALYTQILNNKGSLTQFLDVNESLANKIENSLISFSTFSGFIESIKTRDLTYSRISRALLHILLGIKGNTDYYKEIMPKLTHVRVLSLSKNSELTHEISIKSSIKLMTSIPKCECDFSEEQKKMEALELNASTLYDHVVYSVYGTQPTSEYSKKF